MNFPPSLRTSSCSRFRPCFCLNVNKMCTFIWCWVSVLSHLYLAQSWQLVEFSRYHWWVLWYWGFCLMSQVQVRVVAWTRDWSHPLVRVVFKSWMETVLQAAIKRLWIVSGWLRRLLQRPVKHIIGLDIVSTMRYGNAMLRILRKIAVQTVSVGRRGNEISLPQI